MLSLFRSGWTIFALAWRSRPLAVIVALGEILSTVLRFVQPVAVSMIIAGLTSKSGPPLFTGIGLLISSLAFGSVLEVFGVSRRVRLIGEVGFSFDMEVVRALSALRYLDQLEEPTLSSAISRVQDRADAMGFCFNGLLSVVVQAVAPLTSVVVAVVIDPRLLVLVLAGAPIMVAMTFSARVQNKADDRAEPEQRSALDWAGLLADANARAERRAYALWGWYHSKIHGAVERREGHMFSAIRLDSLVSTGTELFYVGSMVAVLLWVLHGGDADVATTAAALLVALDLRGTLGALRYSVTGLGPTLRGAAGLLAVRRAADLAVERAKTSEQDPPSRVGWGVEGVTYSYDGHAEALRNVSISVAPGSVIAIVGANGAGKSTLIELLLNIRRPSGGKIWHGAPDTERAVITQYFGRFEFRVAEAVGLSDFDAFDSDALRSIERHLQAVLLTDFPVSARLGTSWHSGREPSEGQWQSIAGARCMYREGAMFIALDEPTSALDPEAQDELTTRYIGAARAVAERGGSAVIVTHRMAIPRLCDVVMVLDHGEVVEYGSHAELMKTSGRYSRAFRAATAGYFRSDLGQKLSPRGGDDRASDEVGDCDET